MVSYFDRALFVMLSTNKRTTDIRRIVGKSGGLNVTNISTCGTDLGGVTVTHYQDVFNDPAQMISPYTKGYSMMMNRLKIRFLERLQIWGTACEYCVVNL